MASAATGRFLGVNVTFALDWMLRRRADRFCPLNEQLGKRQSRELLDVDSRIAKSRLQHSLQPWKIHFKHSYIDFTFYNNDVIVVATQKKTYKKTAPRSLCAEKAGKRSFSPLGWFSILIGCFCDSERRADDSLQNIAGGNTPC